MKWHVLGTTVFAATALYSQDLEELSKPLYGINSYDPELDGPDLFRRNEQICSVHLDFLYWTVDQGSLDFALKMKHPAWGPTPSYAQGDVKQASYGADPGFRVGVLFFRAPHYWEVLGQYTRVNISGKNSIHKPQASNLYLTGTWPQITANPLAWAHSHIKMDYNLFDVLASRVYITNPHLRLRVLGGFGGAWLKQEWNVKYSDFFNLGTKIHNRWSFEGGGLKLGTMVDWYICEPDLYFTGSAIFGAFVGGYKNISKQTTNVVPDPADDPSVPIRNAKLRDARSAFSFQLLIGPSWQKNFTCNRIEIFAGYEMNLWFNLQEIYRSTSGVPSAEKQTWQTTNALVLQGLTTRIVYDF
jgi:hypothetical protein